MKKYIYTLFLFSAISLYSQERGDEKSFVLVNISAISPIGIFLENWNIGGGAYLGYGWRFMSEWEFNFQIGYNRYRLFSDSEYSNTPKLSMFAFQIGGRHYFLQNTVKPYITTLGGVNIIRLFYNLDEQQIDERATHLNFQMGGGIVVEICSHLELDLSILYNSHLINPSIPYNLTGFEYGIGAKWVFE